jgi:predicted DNA-binding transcriptional regulator AlpA
MDEQLDKMWTAADVCEYLGGITRRHFLAKVACRPSFPRPFEISRQARLWYPDEVREWVYRNRAKRAA